MLKFIEKVSFTVVFVFNLSFKTTLFPLAPLMGTLLILTGSIENACRLLSLYMYSKLISFDYLSKRFAAFDLLDLP